MISSFVGLHYATASRTSEALALPVHPKKNNLPRDAIYVKFDIDQLWKRLKTQPCETSPTVAGYAQTARRLPLLRSLARTIKKLTADMETEFIVHTKVWIEDKRGNPVFGAGRHAILEAVDRLRSLQAAAKELKMSYRAVWCRIKVSEECLGKALIVRDGRRSKLTPFARELMTAFLDMQNRVRSEADAAFAEHMLEMLNQQPKSR